jgi:acyl-coenzyme A thioesterase PaaI-like protein
VEADTLRERFPWIEPEPGRFIGRGHPAGDLLEAYLWEVIEEKEGYLRLRAHLPDHLRNPRGQLFGGFTPTYVDLVALFTVRAGKDREFREMLATTSMKVEYFEPILGPGFSMESRLVKARGRTHFVETRFFDPENCLAVVAYTTLRMIPRDRPLGDA